MGAGHPHNPYNPPRSDCPKEIDVSVQSNDSIGPAWSWRKCVTAHDSGLSSTQRLVALCLSLYASEQSPTPFPSVARLAKDAGLSANSTREALHELETLGWLTIGRRTNPRGDPSSNVYHFTVPEGHGVPQHVEYPPPARGVPLPSRMGTPPILLGHHVEGSSEESREGFNEARSPSFASLSTSAQVFDPARSSIEEVLERTFASRRVIDVSEN